MIFIFCHPTYNMDHCVVIYAQDTIFFFFQTQQATMSFLDFLDLVLTLLPKKVLVKVIENIKFFFNRLTFHQLIDTAFILLTKNAD